MELLTVKQVCAELHYSRRTVYRLSKKLPVYRVGGQLRFAREDIDALVKSSRQEPEAPAVPNYQLKVLFKERA